MGNNMQEQGYEYVGRRIVISSLIDHYVAERVIEQIYAINDFDDRMSIYKNYQPEPIEMIINSGGGSAYDGFAIIGAMETSNTPIITYGYGLIASMALGIFMAGDVRVAHRFSRFMYHTVSYDAMGSLAEHEETLLETKELQKMYNTLFENTDISGEMMEKIKTEKKNLFISGRKAVEVGIADTLIEPKQRVKLTEEDLEKLKDLENGEK